MTLFADKNESAESYTVSVQSEDIGLENSLFSQKNSFNTNWLRFVLAVQGTEGSRRPRAPTVTRNTPA